MTNEIQCIACGMPMTKPEDFAADDTTKDYCCHCARPDGTMRSYDETLEGMTRFMVKSQRLDDGAARQVVKEMMTRLPAWQDRD